MENYYFWEYMHNLLILLDLISFTLSLTNTIISCTLWANYNTLQPIGLTILIHTETEMHRLKSLKPRFKKNYC